MKRTLVLLLLIGITSLGAGAPDRRISDDDGHILDINSGGDLTSVVKDTNGVELNLASTGAVIIADTGDTELDLSPAGTVIASTGRTISAGVNTLGAAGTAEAVGASSSIHSVHLRASGNNAGVLFLGPSTVDEFNGYQLHTGVTILIRTDNLADIFFDGGSTGDVIEFLGHVQ